MSNIIPSSMPIKAYEKALQEAKNNVDPTQTRTGQDGETIYSDKTGKELYSTNRSKTTSVFAQDGKIYVKGEDRLVISDPSKDLTYYYNDRNQNGSYESLIIYRRGENPEVWENDTIMDQVISSLVGTYTKSEDNNNLQHYDTKLNDSGYEYYNESTKSYEPSMWKDIKAWFNYLF